jgi:guanylate kinase
MLVVLFGTSCVGKTSLIKQLVEKYSFNCVSWFTTRPFRNIDLGRRCISLEEFKKLEENQKFLLVNNSYAYLYGMPLESIKFAENSKEYYVADFRIKDLRLFDLINCIKIIVLPESEFQLIQQIKGASRSERMDEILKDYKNNLNSEKVKEYVDQNCHVFINRNGMIAENVKMLYKLINVEIKIV